jgi:ATP-dependent DNA helicase RecQ
VKSHFINKIRLTSLAREVLFEGDKVQLTTVQKINTEKTELKETKSKSAANSLLKHRRRYAISKDENVPAYVIFSDAALRQMETIRPMSDDEFTIDGVGKAKLENMEMPYKSNYNISKKTKLKTKEASTYKETLLLFQNGSTAGRSH